ncbi:MAG: hypothetical protein VKJ04_11905 [Vampirovibrionales bacterium]|nr:hypothetical protein [Vampirovibrionales bacterium]
MSTPPNAPSLFENEQCSISLDQVTWVEKKRDGAVTIHFPGSDVVLLNKTFGPDFMKAYHRYHHWKSGPKTPPGQAVRTA